MPGNYRLDIPVQVPFYLKSGTQGGRDAVDSEVTIGPESTTFEVVLSDDVGRLEGDVTTDDGPAPASVLLLHDGASLRDVRTGPGGHFIMTVLPPGDYKVCAWDDTANVEYANAEWMQVHAKTVSVTIKPGQTTQVKLTRQIEPAE